MTLQQLSDYTDEQLKLELARRRKPKQIEALTTVDLKPLKDLLKEYIKNLNDDTVYTDEENWKNKIWHTVMETFYGKNFFDWLFNNDRILL